MPRAKIKSNVQTEVLQEAVDAVLKCGSVKAAAESLGIPRGTLQHRLAGAALSGISKPLLKTSNPSRWRPGEEIVKARIAEFERYKSSVERHGNVVFLPDDTPFMVVVLGDPHLDSPGSDLSAWNRWIAVLDRQQRRTAILLGDNLDNWPKALSFLHGMAETPAPEGWILLEYYLDKIGVDLDASVSGNHDDWSGYSDVLGMLMRQHGVLHEAHSVRWAYRTPHGRDITVKARHSWAGRSMWNAAHGIARAAQMGQRETILLGGHIHTSGEMKVKDPSTGKITFCHQVGSFKAIDDFADRLGFLDGNMSPAIALVVDPRRTDTDPDLVKCFHDPDEASGYLKYLRSK